MTPAILATLKPGDTLTQSPTGNLFRVTTTARIDAKGNPYVWALSKSLSARISVSDCEHFKVRRRSMGGVAPVTRTKVTRTKAAPSIDRRRA